MRQKPWLAYTVSFLIVFLLSILLFVSGVLFALVTTINTIPLLAEFIAGFLYSSFVTSPVAMFMIALLSQSHPPLQIALIGGLGTMIADLLLLKFARYLFFGSFSPLTQSKQFTKIINRIHHNKTFNSLAPIVGAIIIASPLPDEIGIAIFGLTKLPTIVIALLTYILNMIGIYILAIIARQII